MLAIIGTTVIALTITNTADSIKVTEMADIVLKVEDEKLS